MLDTGYEPQLMPSLDGESGKSWFRRWRKKFRVMSRKKVKHLKVTYQKLKQRVRVYLNNVCCFAVFMAPLLRRGPTDEVGVLGPETRLVQQHSIGRYLQYCRL